jgi:hypothetical protein
MEANKGFTLVLLNLLKRKSPAGIIQEAERAAEPIQSWWSREIPCFLLKSNSRTQ